MKSDTHNKEKRRPGGGGWKKIYNTGAALRQSNETAKMPYVCEPRTKDRDPVAAAAAGKGRGTRRDAAA